MAEIVKLTLADLYRVAEGYETELGRDSPVDHPAWLQKRAARVRALIVQKERAVEHREGGRWLPP